jgi:hypothetical protein
VPGGRGGADEEADSAKIMAFAARSSR